MNFRNSKGLTIIEVLIAMVILTIIIVVTFNLLFTVIKARNISRERLQALELSTSVIDEIKSYKSSWKDINGLNIWLENDGFARTGNVFDKVETDSNNISYDIQVNINVNTGISGLFEINITAESPNTSQISIATRIRGE